MLNPGVPVGRPLPPPLLCLVYHLPGVLGALNPATPQSLEWSPKPDPPGEGVLRPQLRRLGGDGEPVCQAAPGADGKPPPVLRAAHQGLQTTPILALFAANSRVEAPDSFGGDPRSGA